MVTKESKPKQLSFPDLDHGRRRLVELDAPRAAPHMDLPERDNLVARAAPVPDCDLPFLELLIDLTRPLFQAIHSGVGLGPETALDHEVRMNVALPRPFTPVPAIDQAFDELDVLLRHRLRSISRCTGPDKDFCFSSESTLLLSRKAEAGAVGRGTVSCASSPGKSRTDVASRRAVTGDRNSPRADVLSVVMGGEDW